MGGEREDTDPRPKGAGSDSGIGARGSAGGRTPAAAGIPLDQAPKAVDFNALHAALGDPVEVDGFQGGHGHPDDLLDGLDDAPTGPGPRVSESSGRLSATYASERPRTIPPTRAPAGDLNAPPVIVASDDTVPSAPPHMTVPLAPPVTHGHLTAPFPPPPGHSLGHPSSGPQVSASAQPSYPFTPPSFAVQRPGQMTMRMPERPVSPRRARMQTVVVRNRGPSAKQKLVAFMAMLLLVTACGIAVIIWRKPLWLGLDATQALGLGATTSAPAVPASALVGVPIAPVTAPTVSAPSGTVTPPLPSVSAAVTAAVPSVSAHAAPKRAPKPAPLAPSAAPKRTTPQEVY